MKRFLLVIGIIILFFSLLNNAKAQTNQAVANGAPTAAVTFPGGIGCTYNWVNNTPGIGLAASGAGNIASFTAINTGSSPVTATITATPAPSGFAYIANLISDDVSVFNTITNTTVAIINVGAFPFGVAVNPVGNLVYITNQADGTVSVIEALTNTVTAIVNAGTSPWGVSVSPDGSTVYVSNSISNTISVINAATNTVTNTISTGANPRGIIVSPDGTKLYVTNYGANTVSVINTATNTVSGTIPVGAGPSGLAISPDGTRLYVTNNTSNNVSVVNTITNTVTATIATGTGPIGISINASGSQVYVTNTGSGALSIINAATNTVSSNIPLGGAGPTGVSVNPLNGMLYAVHSDVNTVTIINPVTGTVISTVPTSSISNSFGNFISAGIGCTGTPITFTITVNPSASPAITSGAVSGSIFSCAGTPSASPDIQQFTVSGNNLTAGIVATAPANFEISLNQFSGYGNSVTIGSPGTPTTLYIRSAASAPPGNISGNVLLISTGAPNQSVVVTGFISALPNVNTVPDQTVLNGATTVAVNFTGTANTYNWVNNTPAIGLSASGTGNIAPFTAINAGATPVTATITVTPISPGFAYIANEASGNVSVINTTTNLVTATIPAGANPTGVSVSPDGNTVYVANEGSNTITVINTNANTVTATIAVGNAPIGVLVSSTGNRVYVVNQHSNTVSVINTATNAVVTAIAVGSNPYGIAQSPDGKLLYVTNGGSNNVSVVNTASNAVIAAIAIGTNPTGIAVSPDGALVYVSNFGSGTVSVINALTNTVTATIAVGANPYGIVVSPDGRRLYVANYTLGNVSVINTATNAIVATILSGLNTLGLSVSSDGSLLYATNLSSNNVSVISTAVNSIITKVNVGVNPYSMGNFIKPGTTCDGAPSIFTITVTSTTPPTIITANVLSAVSTTYGTASASTSFTLSGTNLSAGVLVTAPPGFEVSTDNINFNPAVTVGAAGTIAPTPVYIRLTNTTPVGVYSGNIVLTSTGAVTVNLAMPNSRVSPVFLNITPNDATKVYGTALTTKPGPTLFTVTGLKNSETVGSVTLNYGPGGLATAGAGTYTGSLSASAAAGGTFNPANYTIAYNQADVIVTPAPLTITADDMTRPYGLPDPAFTVTYSGFVNNDNPSQLISLPIITTTAVLTSPPGQYPITPGNAVSSNYTIMYVPGVLTVKAVPAVVIPNAFTPNGDGINDTWNIQNINSYPNCKVDIYNRYGENVYSSIGYGIPWDGTFRGAYLPAATYYYIIDLKNGLKALSGYVVVIR